MATLDIFRSKAFSLTSMTDAVNKIGYIPGFLRGFPGLFVPKPVRTEHVFIESRENGPALIQTDQRGAPMKDRQRGDREARPFKTRRLAESSTIYSSEVAGIRAFGTDSELLGVQQEVAERQALLLDDMNLTLENQLLGTVQGVTKDADSGTIYDWAAEFDQTIPAEIDFDLDNANPASGVVRKKCNEVTRSVIRGLKGLGGANVSVMALAGDAFWDDLTAHSEVRQTYLNTQEAASLREGNAFETFRYGGITWTNYRGTDDGTTVAVPTDKAKFFPVNAGIFQIAYAPGENMDLVNTLGQPFYSWNVPDKDDNAWVKVKVASYPLPVCTMPQALHRAKRT